MRFCPPLGFCMLQEGAAPGSPCHNTATPCLTDPLPSLAETNCQRLGSTGGSSWPEGSTWAGRLWSNLEPERCGQTWEGRVSICGEKPPSLVGKKKPFLLLGSTGRPRCQLQGVREATSEGVTANRDMLLFVRRVQSGRRGAVRGREKGEKGRRQGRRNGGRS